MPFNAQGRGYNSAMTATFINGQESLFEVRYDTTNWKALTHQEQIRDMELEGFVVIPDILDTFIRG